MQNNSSIFKDLTKMVISASDSSRDSSPATFGAGIVELSSILLHLSPKWGGGRYFLVKDYRGCAAGWGRIFTTGLTIMGLHF